MPGQSPCAYAEWNVSTPARKLESSSRTIATGLANPAKPPLHVVVADDVDPMPAPFELRDHLGGHSRVDARDREGAVDAGGIYRLLRPHAEIHHLGYELGDAVGYAPSARRAHGHTDTIGPHHQRRCHVVERVLARHDRVDAARYRVEPHHAVVHHHAGALRHEPGPEAAHQRIGERHGVALGVHGAQMRSPESSEGTLAGIFSPGAPSSKAQGSPGSIAPRRLSSIRPRRRSV